MSTVTLTVLHTNDLHGRVDQLARIGTLVSRVREEVEAKGGFCLYLDAGDSEDSILLESALTKGSAMDAVLRGAGCDQVTLGNAIPFRYGIEAIAGLAESFGKPLLCANMFWPDGTRPAGMVPYVIEQCGPLTIGIIGFTAPLDAYRAFKIEVRPPEDLAASLIGQVKEEGANFILVLSHLGLRNDVRLAEKVEGIALIIGGHSHDRLKMPLKINDTLICMAGEYGEILGRLDMGIDPDDASIPYFYENHLAITDQIPESRVTRAVIEQEKLRAQEMMAIEVGTLTSDCEFLEDIECRAGNLLADALQEHFPGADGAFVLGEHWEDGLPAGRITKGQLFSTNRSTGNPGRVVLSGAQLKQFFLAAFKPANRTRSTPVLRGRAPGIPHVAGIRVRVFGQAAERVEITLGNRLVGDDEQLTLVTSDLEVSEYLNYLPIPDEQIEYDIPTILPEVVEGYLRRHDPLDEISLGRITFC